MDKRSSVIPFEPKHKTGLLALWKRHFGEWSATRFDRRWEWQFTTNPFRQFREPELFVAISDATGEIVGGLTTTPVPLRFDGRQVACLCGGALAVDEAFRGRFIDLARRFENTSPALAGGLHPSIRTIAKHFGFSYVPGSSRRFVLWLRHHGSRTRQLRRHLRPSMTRLATPRLVALLPDNLFGRALPPTRPMPTTNFRAEIREISRFGAEYDALWARASSEIARTIERSSVYMNWRHVECPTQTSIRLGLYEGGVLRAIAVGTNRVEHDWTDTPCVTHGEIAELIADDPTSPGVEALVAELMQRLDVKRCDSIASLGLHPTFHPLLRKLGFEDHEDEAFAMVVNPNSGRGDLDLKSENEWYISAADSDALYGDTI